MKFKKISAIIMAMFLTTIVGMYIIPTAYTKTSGEVNLIKVLGDSTLNDSSKVTYTCPMHPEVTSDKPGTCPKCGMDLELKKEDKKDEGMNCPDMKQCKKIGCNMNQCTGNSGGCTDKCPMMKEHKHNDSKNHNHKSGCMRH